MRRSSASSGLHCCARCHASTWPPRSPMCSTTRAPNSRSDGCSTRSTSPPSTQSASFHRRGGNRARRARGCAPRSARCHRGSRRSGLRLGRGGSRTAAPRVARGSLSGASRPPTADATKAGRCSRVRGGLRGAGASPARVPARPVRCSRVRRRRGDGNLADLGGRNAGRRRVGRRLPALRALSGGEPRERFLLAEQLDALEEAG